MEQTHTIDVDDISFDDLLQDLERVKNQMKGPTTRAGTSVSVFIDENMIFQVFFYQTFYMEVLQLILHLQLKL